jgi:hypothetical protein
MILDRADERRHSCIICFVQNFMNLANRDCTRVSCSWLQMGVPESKSRLACNYMVSKTLVSSIYRFLENFSWLINELNVQLELT